MSENVSGFQFVCEHTTRSKPLFSLRAPMQPVKPMTKTSSPAMISRRAGSNGIWLSFPKFWNMSFSVQAQSPMPNIIPPNNWKDIKYDIRSIKSNWSYHHHHHLNVFYPGLIMGLNSCNPKQIFSDIQQDLSWSVTLSKLNLYYIL